jgi:hypothetical protein
MKHISKLNYVMMLVGLIFCFSCSPRQAMRYDADQDLVQLRNWMDNRLEETTEVTAEERQTIRNEYQQLSDRVERKTDRLSEEAQQEFQQLSARFDQWENSLTVREGEQARPEKRNGEMVLDQRQQEEWKNRLLGEDFRKMDELSSEQMKEAYQTFIQNVRDQQENWGEQDWAYAEYVLEQLNERRENVNVPAVDWTRIQAWIAEFNVLQTADKVGNGDNDEPNR